MTLDQSDRPHAFWSRVSRRYAAMPMRNPHAYETTIDRVQQHLRHDQSVLELGCGTGTTALRLAPKVRRFVATDYVPEMVAIARERNEVAPCDTLSLQTGALGDGSLPPGPFDVVLAFNLLHLLPDRKAALAEISDILPRGGLFISKTPCLGGVFLVLQPFVAVLWRMGKLPHIRFLTPARLEREIVAAGFEIVETGTYPKRPPSRFICARKP